VALTLIVGDEKRSGKELTARSLLAAAGLKALGVGREDKVAVLLPNGFEFLEAWKALGALGALAYPLSTDLKLPDLETIVQRERFKAAIVDPLLPGAAVLERIRGPAISAEPNEHSEWNRLIQRVSDPLPESERSSPPGSVFGTSGSTGVPKTVRRLPLDHETVPSCARNALYAPGVCNGVCVRWSPVPCITKRRFIGLQGPSRLPILS
jgi:long-chain acyl-CoA synthetase